MDVTTSDQPKLTRQQMAAARRIFNEMQRRKHGEPRWGPWFAAVLIVVLTTGFAVARHGWTDDVFEQTLVISLGSIAFALTQRSVAVRIAWLVTTMVGAVIVPGLAALASVDNRLMEFPREIWPVGLWGLFVCALSYFTGVPRRKCPACAERISAEAFKCRFCGESLGSARE